MNREFYRNEMYKMLEQNAKTYEETQIAYFWIDDAEDNPIAFEGYEKGLDDYCKDKFNR